MWKIKSPRPRSRLELCILVKESSRPHLDAGFHYRAGDLENARNDRAAQQSLLAAGRGSRAGGSSSG